jgi:HD superfamily phosphodiesterase
VPDRKAASNAGEGAVAGHLLQYVSEALRADPERWAHTLKVYHRVRQLVAEEGGDPRIAVAASLLLQIGRCPSNDQPERDVAGRQEVPEALRQVSADDQTIAAVSEIVGRELAGKQADRIEQKVVRDAETLATLPSQYSPDQHDQLEEIIQTQLTTDAAKKLARSWIKAVDAGARESDGEQLE